MPKYGHVGLAIHTPEADRSYHVREGGFLLRTLWLGLEELAVCVLADCAAHSFFRNPSLSRSGNFMNAILVFARLRGF